jgi:hypothetical protein
MEACLAVILGYKEACLVWSVHDAASSPHRATADATTKLALVAADRLGYHEAWIDGMSPSVGKCPVQTAHRESAGHDKII